MVIGRAVGISIIVGLLAAAGVILWAIGFRAKEPQIACNDCNVVLIALDPLRADALSSYGNPRNTTPTLDALAKKGFLFTQAYAVAPWTLPSAMSLMTGTYPSVHRIINKELIPQGGQEEVLVPARLADAAPYITTVATNLKAQGYATGGFAGGAALSASYGFDQGFDVYKSGDAFNGLPTVLPEAIAFIRSHVSEKFFVFIHGFDVHGQYIPMGGYDRRFVSEYTGKLKGTTEEQKALREEGVVSGRIYLTPEDVAFLRSIYDEKVARADKVISSVINEIETLKLSEKTIVIVTSNHGDEFYEHGRIDHGMTLFDDVLHIPLIMVIPGTAGNIKIPTQVRNIDIIPTIFSLIGETPGPQFREQLRGMTLVPALTGKDLRLNVFAETSYRYATFQKAVRTWDQWKLVTDEEAQMKQLYDINKDPKELKDLFPGGGGKAAELIDVLYTHTLSLQQTKYSEQ